MYSNTQLYLSLQQQTTCYIVALEALAGSGVTPARAGLSNGLITPAKAPRGVCKHVSSTNHISSMHRIDRFSSISSISSISNSGIQEQ